jgi:hypothetical protein
MSLQKFNSIHYIYIAFNIQIKNWGQYAYELKTLDELKKYNRKFDNAVESDFKNYCKYIN